MLLFVVGDLVEDVLLGAGEPGDLSTTGYGAGSGACIGCGEAGAGGAAEVELGFEVFQVQREIEDIGVGVSSCCDGGCHSRAVAAATACENRCGTGYAGSD